jgi:DNA polymerase III epsilon subunit-like protein/ADP-ribose pyrophosphatase YjhB (NUDIX family)
MQPEKTYAKKKWNKPVLSIEEQNQQIRDAAVEIVKEANSNFSGARTVTKRAALAVVNRSLGKREGQAYSIRRLHALKDLNSYIQLAQTNKTFSTPSNTDLLPVSHPASTRRHNMHPNTVRAAKARWFAADPKISNPLVVSLLASAFSSDVKSAEYEYAIARLSALGTSEVPRDALVAAFKMGGNKGFWRFQLRDSEGKFAEMGGGLRKLVRKIDGTIKWLNGNVVSTNPTSKTFVMETSNGKLVRSSSSSSQSIKAFIKGQNDPEGYSKTEAKSSSTSEIVEEQDLEFVESPDGYLKDEAWAPLQADKDYYGSKVDLGTMFVDDNGNYEILKFEKANTPAKDKFEVAQQKQNEGNDVVAFGKGENGALDPELPVYFVRRKNEDLDYFAAVQSWDDVQKFISEDEPKYENGEPSDPTGVGSFPVATEEAEGATPEKESATPEEFKYPEGYYKIAKGQEYTPEGSEDATSPDYTDDPAEIAQRFETGEIQEALEQGVKGNEKQAASGYGTLPFEAGDEFVPAEALYNALKEQGEDADAILGKIYDDGNGTPAVSEKVKSELGGDLPESPIAEGVADPATLPALLDGLSEEEKADYAATGEYEKYLPKNETFDVPEGYVDLNPQPFDKDTYLLPEDSPEGFTFDPVAIANDYSTEDLKGELRRALEPGNETPGYGILGQQTPEGEDYVGNVPGEAIRDALQLQGENTNALIQSIYDEGKDNEPSDQEIADALEGDNVQEEPAQPAESSPQDAQGPDSDKPKAGLPSDNEVSGPQGVSETQAAGKNVGEPTGPAKLTAKVSELKAGDVTVNDSFTIENVFSDAESEAAKPGSVWVEGFYPGHVSQKTKLWYPDTEIAVYRNVDGPTKGDLPLLSKPFAKDYDPEGKVYKDKELDLFVPKDAEARSKYLDDVDQYNAGLTQAKEMWTAPEGLEDWSTETAAPIYTPDNKIGIAEVASVDVKAGDITFKKEWGQDYYEFFVVEGVSTDENGNAVVQGYYPGHESQTKNWKGTTKITVIKNAEAPAAGDKPALERPSKDDPDYKAKKEAFDAAKKESAATYAAPIDLEATTPKAKPARPTPPSFTGDKLKAIAAEANGDPTKFKELLANEEVVHLDFESTGGFKSPSPIQVAMVKMKNGQIVDQKTLFMNPEQALDSFYTDKDPSEVLKDSDGNPISDDFLAKQMSQLDAFKEIADFLGASPIVSAHNMPFDGEILKRKFAEFGIEYAPGGEIDTLSLARKVINGQNGDHTLQAVANRYGLAEPDTDWHDAAVDSAVLPGILDNLLDEMAISKSGIDALDIDKTQSDYESAKAEYDAFKSKKDKGDSELIMAKAFSDGMAGEKLPTTEELASALPKDLPTSDEISSATTAKPTEVSDNDFEIDSVLGGVVTNNWVSDPENATNIGKIAVEEWLPGDFIKALHGGYHEIISVEPDPENDKKSIVTRRLLANGKEYTSSWVKYQTYEVIRRNSAPVIEPKPEPELEQPQLEIDGAPEKEANAGKWNDYTIAQGTDGVYYAENISAADVQGLRNGTLTPPNLPFFAPLGGGNNQETGEGYFFTTDGKRFWGKYGAAGALVRRKNADGDYEYFLAKRSKGLSQGGGTWGTPGGAHKDQTIAKAYGATAKEEFQEEVGGDITALEPIYVDNNLVGKEWAYDTYVFEVGPNQLNDLKISDGENSETGWFTADQIKKMSDEGKLHPSFADSIPNILNNIESEDAKVVDKPTPTPEIKAADITTVFDTSAWVKSGSQDGSNKGAYYTDPTTGFQYYVKTPKSDKHAANEVLGGALYDAAGTKFGRAYLGKDKKGNTVLVSQVLDGAEKDFADKKSDAATKSSAQEDFAVDAWLGNYDAVGLAYDNMLTKGKDVFRVDAGGALLFRAQGGTDKDFGPEATQIDSMRDAKTNPQAADIFNGMTDEQIAESVKKVQAITPEKIDELVDASFPDDKKTADELKSLLKARREYLIERFLGGQPQEEPSAPEAVEEAAPSTSVKSIDVSGTLPTIVTQVADAIDNKEKISFKYNGKERVAFPLELTENPANGNINVTVVDDADGATKKFTLQKFEQSDVEAPVSTEVTPDPETQMPDVIAIDPDEKQKVLDEVSNLAEKLFGSKGKTKDLLETLKGQDGVNTEIIDSILKDLDAPEELTQDQKIESDLAQALTPDPDVDADSSVGVIDPIALAEELKTPLNPDLIWAKVKDEYSASSLENGHIVVGTSDDGTSIINTVVKRNSNNTFSIYHRILNKETGETKVKEYDGKWHSFTALKSRIDGSIERASKKPKSVKSGSKAETASSILPAAVPTQKGAYVSADGKTPLKVGMKVRTIEMKSDGTKVEKTGTVISLKDEYTTGKSKAKPEGYTYTDVAKVKWDDSGKKNWKVSSYLEITDSSGAIETPEMPNNEGEEGGGTGGTPVEPTPPTTPTPVAGPTPEVSTPTFEGLDLVGAETIADVELKAVNKNSDGHMATYGANNYSDYKQFLSGEFIKDPNSKNMVPGIIVQNDSPNTTDPELVSYGVISSQNAKTGDIEVSYFDGPLAGKKQTLKSDKVWSREKFLTPEQAQELDITLDSTLFDKSKAAAKAKGEEYAKQQAIQAEKAKKQAEQEAAKAKILADKKALKEKFQVNGPGFQVQTLDAAEVDFSQSPVEGVPSLDEVLTSIQKSNTPLEAAKGLSTLVDADSIEDLDVHIGLVTDKTGVKKLRVQFTLTDWAANAQVAQMEDDSKVKKSESLKIPKWSKAEDGSLTESGVWDSGSVDQSKTGTTLTGKIASGTFSLHRAIKGTSAVDFFKNYKYSNNSVAFHNKVEILLPENASSTDVAQALQEFGAISEVRPATKEDVKGVIENKMIWMYGADTDGKKNFAGELRQKTLDNIKETYGFTADDVEIVVDPYARGRISFYAPESAAEKLMEITGSTPYYVHSWKGSYDNTVEWFYNLLMSGGVYATTNRWMNGINIGGWSSEKDIKANGGNYVFMSPSTTGSDSGNHPRVFISAKRALRRLDFYKNNSDEYGQLQSDSEDIVTMLKNQGGELMFKKNLSWADVNTISLPASIREKLIQKLLDAGETSLADMVAGKQKAKKGKK